jgi:hypothetical protein
MQTNSVHLLTAYLPLWILALAFVILILATKYDRLSFQRSATIIVLLGIASSIFTGGMGGASMSKTELMPGIDLVALHTHAWTAALSIGLFIFLGYLSFRKMKAVKNGRSTVKINYPLFIVLFLVVLCLIWTILTAHHIRI